MRDGTIEIESGRWSWSLVPRWRGGTVLFRRPEKPGDEMRAWVPKRRVSEAEVRGLARDPLERIWVDVDGLAWRVSLESPLAWRRWAGSGPGEEGVCLVFRRGGIRLMIPVGERPHLGALTSAELRLLFEQALVREIDDGPRMLDSSERTSIL